MSGGYYKINRDVCAKYNLIGREAMVYNALLYLCARGPYTGSASDIAGFSFCGGYKTALRMLDRLQEKELISYMKVSDKLLNVSLLQQESSSQNGYSSSQNDYSSSQNGCISKEEKENQKKKENIKKDNEVNISFSACEEKKTASPKDLLIYNLFQMQPIIPGDKPAIPANTGYYKIIVTEYGYLNPKEFVKQFYNYWDGQGWPERGNKLSLMRSWMDRYIRMKGAKKPNLNEIERIVMKTFLDHIEERLIVRLFNVVRQFEVTDTIIYFYVPESNANDFVVWLNTLPLKLWFEAYNRTVSVRSLKD